MDFEAEPFLLAQINLLRKNDKRPTTPDHVWMITAMPGNLSVAGQTEAEVRENFALLVKSLVMKITATGSSLESWWTAQMAAMTDDEKRAWRRVVAPVQRFELPTIEGVRLLMNRKVNRYGMARAA